MAKKKLNESGRTISDQDRKRAKALAKKKLNESGRTISDQDRKRAKKPTRTF